LGRGERRVLEKDSPKALPKDSNRVCRKVESGPLMSIRSRLKI
jgi:hypothetical protein